jgi:hypothetical protein
MENNKNNKNENDDNDGYKKSFPLIQRSILIISLVLYEKERVNIDKAN